MMTMMSMIISEMFLVVIMPITLVALFIVYCERSSKHDD